MSNQHAAPQCYVDICPFEGGKYTFSPSSAGVLAVRVSAPCSMDGGFAIDLAPGGPNGPNADPSWADIITPMSLVVIGMSRGTYRRTVMVGLVTQVSEGWDRTSNPVQRVISVQGADFSLFFNLFSYYNLNALTGLNEGALGSLGLLGRLSDALLSGTPDTVGKAWLNLMVGPNGLLASTRIPYLGGTALTLQNVISSWLQPFNGPVDIPTAANFLGDEGTWTEKFGTFFPSPWYEFFLTTADVGFYPAATKPASPIALSGFPNAAPTLVARVRPLPTLKQGSSSLSIDTALWQALPSFTPDPGTGGPAEFELGYSTDEVHNFFVLNPTILSTLFGGGNTNVSPFAYNYSAYIDVASIHRYGYRPLIAPLQWMADPAGIASRASSANGALSSFDALMAALTLRLASYYEPTALMARATVRLPLRPDIMPGCKFVANPRKTPVPWTFYVDAVEHDYSFGGFASTTLTLSRGLPSSVYNDAALLTAVHTGGAQRLNGTIQAGTASGLGPTLKAFDTASAQALVQATAGVFSLQNSGASP